MTLKKLKYTNKMNEKNIQLMWEQKKKEFDRVLQQLQMVQEGFISKSFIVDVEGFHKINKFLPTQTQEFKLLYRASENEFSPTAFHRSCDNIVDTLLIAKTNFGKIIGGFTPLTWEQLITAAYKPDQSGQSFLFSLTLNQKYKLVDKQFAICNSATFGPIFGAGHDLSIGDQCNNPNGAYARAYFPTSYNNDQYLNNQNSYAALCGQTNGIRFKILQYEIFKVIWK